MVVERLLIIRDAGFAHWIAIATATTNATLCSARCTTTMTTTNTAVTSEASRPRFRSSAWLLLLRLLAGPEAETAAAGARGAWNRTAPGVEVCTASQPWPKLTVTNLCWYPPASHERVNSTLHRTSCDGKL